LGADHLDEWRREYFMNAWKGWLHGLGAATISAFAGAVSGMATLPSVFNFTHDGLINVGKLTLAPALFAAAGYLKQSPLPAASVTVTASQTISETKE
jgi:hypothetical protein